MSKYYVYEPQDRPIVGGHSATFGETSRRLGQSTAIAATKRIIYREPYEPTGDKAFDLRAQAFRNALLRGTREAFQESHEGFMTVGLYWQGTYGNPQKTKRFAAPPTNSQQNYSPGWWDLWGNDELQEWMFMDFNYAAWLWVKNTDPYDARKTYVKLADQLLKRIPGPHQAVMDNWPKWSIKNSPPVPGGLYPNPEWMPESQSTKHKEPDAPKQEGPKSEVLAVQPAAGSRSPYGPTLLEQPLTNPPEGGKTLPIAEVKAPKLLKPPQNSIHAPLNLEVNPVHGANLGSSSSDELIGPLKSNVPPSQSTTGKLGGILPVPAIEGPKAHEVVGYDDATSTISKELSLDLNAAMAGAKGTYPDPVTIEGTAGTMQTPAQHLAMMGRIGAEIGSLIGLAVVGLKLLKWWPFNKKKKTSKKEDDDGAPGVSTKHRRSHPRSWTTVNESTTQANVD